MTGANGLVTRAGAFVASALFVCYLSGRWPFPRVTTYMLCASGEPLAPRARRLAWAELLKRTFAIDVLRCVHCGGRRELLAVVMKPEAVAAILTHLGLVRGGHG